MQTHYDLLQVTKEASNEEITRSYKKLALAYHPDMTARNLRRENPLVTEAEITQAKKTNAEQFQKIGRAYSMLSDPESRRRYDTSAHEDTETDSYMTGSFDSGDFFKKFPLGHSVDRTSFKEMRTKMNAKLDKTLAKARWDCRYKSIERVINELKLALTEAEPKNDLLNNITPEIDSIPSIKIYEFLVDAQIAIQQAKASQEPQTHRGLLLGTPVLRELTILALAIMRFILFWGFKLRHYIDNNPDPVFKNGFCVGLFQPPKTQTSYYLDSMEKELFFREKVLKGSIDGLTVQGKGLASVCLSLRDEYVVEEWLHYSM